MALFTAEVTIKTTFGIEANNAREAREKASRFASWLEPTSETLTDYNTDHDQIDDVQDYDVDQVIVEAL